MMMMMKHSQQLPFHDHDLMTIKVMETIMMLMRVKIMENMLMLTTILMLMLVLMLMLMMMLMMMLMRVILMKKIPLLLARLCFAHSLLASNFGSLSEHIFVFVFVIKNLITF